MLGEAEVAEVVIGEGSEDAVRQEEEVDHQVGADREASAVVVHAVADSAVEGVVVLRAPEVEATKHDSTRKIEIWQDSMAPVSEGGEQCLCDD
jgi:hypothetical protein